MLTLQTMGSDTKNFWGNMLINRSVELVIVFVGVYAAFLLNAHQNREQDRQRRSQILAYLQHRARASDEDLKKVTAAYDEQLHEFLTELAKGDMPEVQPLSWATDYNANDTAWLLQAGGMGLLNIETLARIKDVDSAQSSGWSLMAHYQQLSDQLIAPHLGEERDYFYDPATKQLRKQYAKYPDILKAGSSVLHNLLDKLDPLEKQLEIERKQ